MSQQFRYAVLGILLVAALAFGYYKMIYLPGQEEDLAPVTATTPAPTPKTATTPAGGAGADGAAGTDGAGGASTGPTGSTGGAAGETPGAGSGLDGLAGTAKDAGGAATANVRLVAQDGDSGNNAYALRIARIVTGIARKNGLVFKADVQLVPGAGGLDLSKPALRKYRGAVKAVTLRVSISDDASMQQWRTSDRQSRTAAVAGYHQLLQRLFPAAARSISVVGTDQNLLAISDGTGTAAAKTRLFG